MFVVRSAGASKESDEWRRRLIVAINRSDKSFNPNNAKICSRHFEGDSLITSMCIYGFNIVLIFFYVRKVYVHVATLIEHKCGAWSIQFNLF